MEGKSGEDVKLIWRASRQFVRDEPAAECWQQGWPRDNAVFSGLSFILVISCFLDGREVLRSVLRSIHILRNI